MRSRVVRWGNSLGLRIPRVFAEEIRVSDGTEVELRVADGQLVIEAVPTPRYSLDGLLAGVTEQNLHGEVETGGAVGGEAW